MIAESGKPYSEGDVIKSCLVKAAEHVCTEKTSLFKNISLTRNIVAERIEDMSLDLNQ